jgi:hypothetical protein
VRALVLVVLLAGCGGESRGSWNPSDVRKLAQADKAVTSMLSLCQEDAGTCVASQVRALGNLAQCKVSSVLNAHGSVIPEDAGGGCTRDP